MSSTLWLLDRSRVVDGRGYCQRARALGYHLGPNGYGITLKATRLPLMTGIAAHEGVAPILAWCRDHDDLIVQGLQAAVVQDGEPFLPVPREVVRAAVAGAQAAYWKVVEVRGFAYLDDLTTQEVTREQNYLIEGLIWAWCLEVLPEILTRGRVVEVEHDDTYVFGCTCGLGDGVLSKADHEARECQGLGLMCRPDFIVETRLTLELEYHEFKTTAMDSVTFRDKWEVMIQMFAATLDAERRLGKHVQSIYIHGLIKGKREGEYNYESGKKDGAYRQQSIFCYGYRKPANPPMEQEEWSAQYEYVGEDGKNHRLGKAWRKTGVWELPESLLPAGMTRGEFWASWMPGEVRRKQLVLIGPLTRQTQMVEHFLAEAVGEEARWQEGLWELYDCAQELLQPYPQGDTACCTEPTCQKCQGVGHYAAVPDWWAIVWPDARFQRLLDLRFPRSYECRRYGARNKCQFEDPCLGREGWADPVGSGRYIERRPHHRDELEQAIGRGLLLPEVGVGEEGEAEF